MATPIVPLSAYPLIQNARVFTPGRIQSRPAIVKLTNSIFSPNSYAHSVRRLNDNTVSESTFIVGVSNGIYFSETVLTEFVLTQILGSGFSGNPLSLIPFEPPSTPSPWMYGMDLTYGGFKVNVSGTIYAQGIAPPLNPPTATFPGPPSYQVIDLFNEAAPGNWTWNDVTTPAITQSQIVNITIESISYDNGNTGWATIYPSANLPGSLGEGVFLTIGTGSNQETAFLDSVLTSLTSSTIASISYDSGNTGLCTIIPASNGFVPAIDQLIGVNIGNPTGEYVPVESIQINPAGQVLIQTFTENTHNPGEPLTGVKDSLRLFLQNTHVAGEAISAYAFDFTVTDGTSTTDLFSELIALDLALIQNRPQQTTDTVSIWINLNAPSYVTHFIVEFDVDPMTNNFTENYYSYDAVSEVSAFTANTWNQVSIPISSFSRTGSASTNWENVAAVGISVTASGIGGAGTLDISVMAFSLYGQYGPDQGSGQLYQYVQRYRSSTTGATSNPGPANRPGVAPSGESVVVTGIPATDPQVDTADFFRIGGTLTDFLLVGSSPCGLTVVPQVVDDFMDLDLDDAEELETDNDQPFTVPGLPASGLCNVEGYTVGRLLPGDNFNPDWPQGTGIFINGIANTLYQQPNSLGTEIVLNSPAGSQTNVPWSVPEPDLLSQPMQVMFGPYGEGNAGLTLFACGNNDNAGTLFWTNGNNADAAGSANNLAITSPSEPLMNGGVFADQPFVFSIKRLFRLVPNFSTDAEGNPIGGFLAYDEGSGYGLFSPWAMCVGPKIYYFAGDSIRENVLGGISVSITDPDISLLFPHGESPGIAIQIGTVTIYPPNLSQPDSLRLSWGNSHLFFDYLDTIGNKTTLVWNPVTRTWSLDTFSPGSLIHYWDESEESFDIVMGGYDGNLWTYSATSTLDQPFLLRMPVRGDQGTYLGCRDLYLAAALAQNSTVIVNVDGVDYTVPVNATPSGGYQRNFYNLPDLKGQAWSFGITSGGYAEVYLKDSEAHMKQWSEKAFKMVQPYRALDAETKP